MVTLTVYGMPFYEMTDAGGYFDHHCMIVNHTWKSLSKTVTEVLSISNEEIRVFLLQDCVRPIRFKKEGVVCIIKGLFEKPEWTSQILDKLSEALIDRINELIRKLLPENHTKVGVIMES
jgi:hypothetical protein